MLRARLVLLPLSALLISLLTATSEAQVATDINNGESTPTPGVGHNYINFLAETVDPGNGSLNVTVRLPITPSRGNFAFPFGIVYDSNGTSHLQPTNPPGGITALADKGYLSSNGWSYAVPMLSFYSTFNSTPWQLQNGIQYYATCFYVGDFVFTDPSGGRHSLYLSYLLPNQIYYESPCSHMAHQPQTYLSDAYGQYQAYIDPNHPYANYAYVYVASPDGTTYKFLADFTVAGQLSGNGAPASDTIPQTRYSLPAIEDRNGNQAAISASGPNTSQDMTDTPVWVPLAYPGATTSGFGANGNTITPLSSSGPYTVSWGTNTFTDSPPYTLSSQGDGSTGVACPAPGGSFAPSAGSPVITGIALPSGQGYQFLYDATSGRLGKIIYPTGGWVQYAWGPNPLSDFLTFPAEQSHGGTCSYRYDTVAVAHRYVSFDGTNIALQQDFSYSTTWDTSNPQIWDTKQTVMTTHDLVTGLTYNTVYNYTPQNLQGAPNSGTTVAGQAPVEQSVVYHAPNGSTLHTETKSWAKLFLETSVCETLDNNSTSGFFNTYNSNNQLTDKKEFDFGAVQPSNCQTGTAPTTTPLRETAIQYQAFANTPVFQGGPSILGLPCQAITSGSGTRVAETDYFYDGSASTTPCATASTQSLSGTGNYTAHDETNYGSSLSPPRGNLTTTKKQCFNGPCGSGNPAMAFTYDETGQMLSAQDADGNTTQYSYSDSYSSGDTLTSSISPPANTNAYLTKIMGPTTNSINHIRQFSYDYPSGQLTISVDENNNSTSYRYDDPFARPTKASYPDGGTTTVAYNDSPYNPATSSPSVTTTKAVNSSTNLVSLSAMDGLGHVLQTRLTSDPDGTDYTAATYDGLGRAYQVYNPTRCNPPTTNCNESTWGYATTAYDALGRVTSVTAQDGSAVTASYSANCTTATDQAAKARKSCTDGLGRLTQVFEDPLGANYETDYGYDALDNLLCVGQKGTNTGTFSNCASIPASWRPRTFAYDSLSRLTSATNPESGTISYAYDANGDLSSKTSPAPNQTGSATLTLTYCYDALNRITGKSYSAQSCPMSSPDSSFVYDLSTFDGDSYFQNPVGRLISTQQVIVPGSNPIVANTWTDYDNMGRIQHLAQCARYNCGPFGSNPYWWTVTNTYDLAGDLHTYTDANGNLFTQAFNAAGRPVQLSSTWSDSTHPATLVSVPASTANPGYVASGALRTATLGNGLTETNVYNNRLQACRMATNSSGTAPGSCSDTNTGNVLDFSYGYNVGANNGNITSWKAAGQQTFNRSYAYDSLNRVTAMSAPSDPSGCLGLAWNYDAWGNRTNQTTTGGSCYQQPVTTFTTQNQFPSASGYTYDAAGNMTSDGTNFYFYDAENRIGQVYPSSIYGYQSTTPPGCTASGVTCYFYNADGQRIAKYQDAGVQTTFYIYDINGEVVADTDVNLSWNETYIHFGGQFIGQYRGASTGFILKDDLGSTRLDTVFVPTGGTPPSGCTVPSGTTYCVYDNMDYLPFGEQIAGSSGVTHKFTGKERDTESGLDNFGARYNSSSMGRFMSPDEPLIDQEKGSPQSWNLYSYVRNNPLNSVDPDGHDCVYLDNNGGTNPNGPGGASIDHNSTEKECQGTGGFWANGTVVDLSYVTTLPNDDAVHIWSHYRDVVGETWAGPGYSFGDKYANMIPGLQQHDTEFAEGWAFFVFMSGQLHFGGGDEEEEPNYRNQPMGSRRWPLDMGPEGEEAIAPTNRPATIGGRAYSGHALDGMQEGGITPTVVEEVIAAGTRSPGSSPGTTKCTAQKVTVVINQSGRVVTVFYSRK